MQATLTQQKAAVKAPENRGISTVKTWILRLVRLFVIVLAVMILIPDLNPVRVLKQINFSASLFTTAVKYEALAGQFNAMVWRLNILDPNTFYTLMHISAAILISVLVMGVGACMSLGNDRMKRISAAVMGVGAIGVLVCMGMILNCYEVFEAAAASSAEAARLITPMLPVGRLTAFAVASGVVLLGSLVVLVMPAKREAKLGMDEKFRLFLMFLPVLVLTFIFSYLPLYGWRFAFFDYQQGIELTMDSFKGLFYFEQLFNDPANREDLLRVLTNTLAMSGLGIATSWLPIAFAILLAELRYNKLQRAVQTLTTIPNFISWVLVYSIALAIFGAEGFVNSILKAIAGNSHEAILFLNSPDGIWIKMLLWGTWKGLGWSAIVYIAGIAGIDQQLYEAARVDGANRWQCIRHITIPGLMPTYMVMLLMSVAGILSNGMEQYLVFSNPSNMRTIEVLDLYVYRGIQNSFEMSTIMGMFKSVIGIALLFGANGISKAVRGESII